MIELSTSSGVLDRLNPTTLPDLSSQAKDISRASPVSYVCTDEYLDTMTSDPCFRWMQRKTTEYEALNEFLYFMEMVEPYLPDYRKGDARELRSELTFLGMPELHFAATALAKRLRHHLEVDNKPVYVDVGNSLSQCRDDKEMKSSQYILSLVLSKFPDDEFEECEGRLKVYGGRGGIDKSSKILFLDDWIVSGNQVKERIAGFEVDNDPEDHEASVLVMAASGDYLDGGISAYSQYGGATYPVEACYRLKNSPDAEGMSRVTGIHSSTDNTFGYEVDGIAYCAIKRGILKGEGIDELNLPALANIVRPYLNGKNFDGLSRFRQLLEKG